MAVRRAKRRRNAGAPTSGALLVNPRRRKRKPTKRRNTRKGGVRKSARKAYKGTAQSRRAAARKAAATRRRNAAKRSRAAKKAAATRRRNGTKAGMRRKTARRAYAKAPRRRRNTRRRSTRKGMTRKTARRAYRRNPNAIAGIQSAVKRVPVIGGMLSDVVGLGVPAAFGAVSILPIEWGLKAGGRYLPAPLQKVSFTVGGLVMGALAKKFLPASASVRDKFAIALATAGGAVDFYRWRTGQGTVQAMEAAESAGFGALEIEAAGELGELEIMDGFGELEIMDGFGGYGELEIMDGMGAYGDMGYDLVNFPEGGDWVNEASFADASFAGEDMDLDEIDAALSGPRRFQAKFVGPRRFRGRIRRQHQRGRGGPSEMAGRRGVRWGWLIKLVGRENFRKIAALPGQQRRDVIRSLKDQAVSSLPSLLEADSYSDDASASSSDGFGAFLYAG